MNIHARLLSISNSPNGWGMITSDEAQSISHHINTLSKALEILRQGNEVLFTLFQSVDSLSSFPIERVLSDLEDSHDIPQPPSEPVEYC
jgi:hypothetical protein